MAYCFEHAIPHSHYLGGPHVWLPEDRDKNLAYMIERSSTCSMCGTSAHEWEADRYAYEATVQTCLGCQLKDLAREDAQGAGNSIVLLPKEEAARLRESPKSAPRRRRG